MSTFGPMASLSGPRRASTERDNRDVELARRVSAEARTLGLESDPSQVQVVAIAVAQDAGSDVGPFWAAALGYRSLGAGEDVVDRHRRNPHVSFQPLHPPKPGRGRPTSTSACLQIKPKVVSRRQSRRADAWPTIRTCPTRWTLASPDNHGVDIAAWPDFEDFEDDEG